MELNSWFFWEQATGWKLEEAIQLFFVGNEGGPVVTTSHSQPEENINYLAEQHTG